MPPSDDRDRAEITHARPPLHVARRDILKAHYLIWQAELKSGRTISPALRGDLLADNFNSWTQAYIDDVLAAIEARSPKKTPK